jgi:hypothetical protein
VYGTQYELSDLSMDLQLTYQKRNTSKNFIIVRSKAFCGYVLIFSEGAIYTLQM